MTVLCYSVLNFLLVQQIRSTRRLCDIGSLLSLLPGHLLRKIKKKTRKNVSRSGSPSCILQIKGKRIKAVLGDLFQASPYCSLLIEQQKKTFWEITSSMLSSGIFWDIVQQSCSIFCVSNIKKKLLYFYIWLYLDCHRIKESSRFKKKCFDSGQFWHRFLNMSLTTKNVAI